VFRPVNERVGRNDQRQIIATEKLTGIVLAAMTRVAPTEIGDYARRGTTARIGARHDGRRRI